MFSLVETLKTRSSTIDFRLVETPIGLSTSKTSNDYRTFYW